MIRKWLHSFLRRFIARNDARCAVTMTGKSWFAGSIRLQRHIRAVSAAQFNRITTGKRLISFSASERGAGNTSQVSSWGHGRFIVPPVIITRNKLGACTARESPSRWNLILNCDQMETYWRDDSKSNYVDFTLQNVPGYFSHAWKR